MEEDEVASGASLDDALREGDGPANVGVGGVEHRRVGLTTTRRGWSVGDLGEVELFVCVCRVSSIFLISHSYIIDFSHQNGISVVTCIKSYQQENFYSSTQLCSRCLYNFQEITNF